EDGAHRARDRSVDRDGGPARAQVHDGQGVAHLAGLIAAVFQVLDAGLADAVVAPALHLAAIEQHTGVVRAPGDRLHRPSGAEVDEREVVAHLTRDVAARARVAVPELAAAEGAVPAAPALDL